jgi:tRNA 2-thiouridine synthesizing protein A
VGPGKRRGGPGGIGDAEPAARASDEAPDLIDLRGLLCPLTWARTKYALGKLAHGASLRVLLDHRPAVPDIRRNAEELGYEVAEARELDAGAGVWEMVLRRG